MVSSDSFVKFEKVDKSYDGEVLVVKNLNVDINSNNKLGISEEKEIYLGDIIINLNKINNKKNDKKFKNQLNKLWIHGFLHLLGHNHKLDKEYCKMQKLENKFLNFVK